MVTVRILTEAELAWANQRYAEVRFLLSGPTDLVAVAEVEGERAGIGRLVPVAPDTAELGGIYVFPEFRGRQVARALVSFLLSRSPYDRLFCVPFSRLDGFYTGFGFVAVASGHPLPGAIAEKAGWCARKHADPVSVLVRAAP